MILKKEKNSLNSQINCLKGVGFKYYNLLFSLGIETIRDLLFYFPFRWDNFSNVKKIAQIKPNEKITILGQIVEIKNIRSFYKKLTITEALVKDETGNLKVVWFNQPFLTQNLIKGAKYRLNGKIKYSKNQLILQSPSYEKAKSFQAKNSDFDQLIPIYSITKGLTPKMLRYLIRQALEYIDQLNEYLPKEIIKNQKLISNVEAIKNIHFPQNFEMLKKAKKRLVFDELFIFQLNYQLKKYSFRKNKSPKISKKIPYIKKILKNLPFSLTNDQKIAIWEIINDLEKNSPMNRLLEGDVGSGKTIVATICALNTAQNNYQSVLMAPTEILAKQHFEQVTKLAKKHQSACAILTRSLTKILNSKTGKIEKIKKDQLKKLIKKGGIKIIVGTHSIIQKDVEFKNLALNIIDEQHRFGVMQRSFLTQKSQGNQKSTPHLLSMTATPIPRTLSLTIFGDLDISIINQLPKGRKKIITKIIPPDKRTDAYEFIRNQIEKGRQVFVICPLIEESEVLNTKAAEKEYEKLNKQIFPDLKIGLLHGKLKPKEKEKLMRNFSKNKISILVSTSVVEVGVDVPNASIMMIEGAERFGLSQLHQFRGRVGRGKYQSYCFLFTESPSSKTAQRLKYLEKTQNGFKLAQKDLDLRGPGEFLGHKQSGFSFFAIASLKDINLIKASRQEAQNLVEKDPDLKTCPILKKKMEKFKDVHFE
ncbi:MAG: ATP-dependent DNA helicase RecG [Candidatus Moranbacteria bacterium]|nr:ATP-dependent DNA helicase RecG [Candidatus Moranbacteria bacterium]